MKPTKNSQHLQVKEGVVTPSADTQKEKMGDYRKGFKDGCKQALEEVEKVIDKFKWQHNTNQEAKEIASTMMRYSNESWVDLHNKDLEELISQIKKEMNNGK